MEIKKIISLYLLGMLLLAGCSRNNPVAPSTAPAQGRIQLALEAADEVASGKVTITKGVLTQILPISITSHTGSVLFESIQVGTWTIIVQLFDKDGVEIYSGSGEAVVSVNTTTCVSIRVNHNTGDLEVVVELPDAVPGPVIAFITRNPGTQQWEFYQLCLASSQKDLLFTLPTTNTGEITALDYQKDRGFVFVQKEVPDTIWIAIWTVAKDGSQLQEQSIQKRDFKIEYPRWNGAGTQLEVSASCSGVASYSTIYIYTASLSGTELGILGGTSGVWTPDNRVVSMVFGNHYRGGSPDDPDYMILSDVARINPIILMEGIGYPLDCSSDNQLLYAVHSDSTTYGIKSMALFAGAASVVIKDSIPDISGGQGVRVPNVRLTRDNQSIIYESADGIYQMNREGSCSKKLTNGHLPVVLQ
jgi:hypothetical protein